MRNTIQIIVALLFTLLIGSGVKAQQPDFLFEHPYPYPIVHTLMWETPYTFAMEVAPDNPTEGGYLIAMSDFKDALYYETDDVAQPIVYKVSFAGDIIGELALGFDDRYSQVIRLFNDPADARYFIAIGTAHDNSLHYDRPFMAKFDLDLNLLWQRVIELPEPYHNIFNMGTIMDRWGDIVCFSPNGADSNPVFYRLTTEGELAAISEYPYPYYLIVNNCSGLFEYQDKDGGYGQVVDSEDARYLIRVDRDLELVSVREVPKEIWDYNQGTYLSVSLSILFVTAGIPLPDGSVILGGDGLVNCMDSQHNWTDYDVIGFMKIDPEGNLIDYAMGGQDGIGEGNDSIKTMTANVCTDMVGSDAFYFSYAVGEPYGFGYDYINCFVVTMMDVDGNVIWHRYWDRYKPQYAMKVYDPQSVTTTSDNGCLVSGYCYCSNINGTQVRSSAPEIFALKFFADGTLSVPEAEAFVRPYMFWPNPVSDQLNFEFSPDVMPTKIELYDLQGRLVRSQANAWQSLNMEGLAAGQYVMKVTMEDGKVFSDKVVKE